MERRGGDVVIDKPEQLMRLCELAADARPPADDLLREMGIDPAIMADFHLLDLEDTLDTLFGSKPEPGQRMAIGTHDVAAIIASHGTVLLQLGYQLGRGDVDPGDVS